MFGIIDSHLDFATQRQEHFMSPPMGMMAAPHMEGKPRDDQDSSNRKRDVLVTLEPQELTPPRLKYHGEGNQGRATLRLVTGDILSEDSPAKAVARVEGSNSPFHPTLERPAAKGPIPRCEARMILGRHATQGGRVGLFQQASGHHHGLVRDSHRRSHTAGSLESQRCPIQ